MARAAPRPGSTSSVRAGKGRNGPTRPREGLSEVMDQMTERLERRCPVGRFDRRKSIGGFDGPDPGSCRGRHPRHLPFRRPRRFRRGGVGLAKCLLRRGFSEIDGSALVADFAHTWVILAGRFTSALVPVPARLRKRRGAPRLGPYETHLGSLRVSPAGFLSLSVRQRWRMRIRRSWSEELQKSRPYSPWTTAMRKSQRQAKWRNSLSVDEPTR